MTKTFVCESIGKWRITEADLWDRSFLDLVEPADITPEDDETLEIELRFHLGDEAILNAQKR